MAKHFLCKITYRKVFPRIVQRYTAEGLKTKSNGYLNCMYCCCNLDVLTSLLSLSKFISTDIFKHYFSTYNSYLLLLEQISIFCVWRRRLFRNGATRTTKCCYIQKLTGDANCDSYSSHESNVLEVHVLKVKIKDQGPKQNMWNVEQMVGPKSVKLVLVTELHFKISY